MAFHYSPKSVTDKLMLALDAGNPNSYPGSGTTWYDLSGNNYHFTLVNSPTFGNHKNTPGFTFDKVDDYARYLGPVQQDFGSECSFQIVVSSIGGAGFGGCSRLMATGASTTSGQDYQYYFCFASCDAYRFGIWYNYNNTGLGGIYPTSPLGTANDDYRVVVYTWSAAANSIKIYVNGVLETTNSFTATVFNYALVDRLVIGANNGFGENSYVRVNSVLMYNKQLSATEVQQNYNALKARFSL